MTPTDLANKIAEEVFRTIEREKAIVKAEIVEGIERVIAKEMPEFLQARVKTWGLWSDYATPGNQAAAPRRDAEMLSSSPVFEHLNDAGSAPNTGGGFIGRGQTLKLGEWKRISKETLEAKQRVAEAMAGRDAILEQLVLTAKPNAACVIPFWMPHASEWLAKLGRSDLRLVMQYNLRNRAYALRGLEFSEIVVHPSVALSPEEKEGLDHLRVQVRANP